jgi:hypothetical protein
VDEIRSYNRRIRGILDELLDQTPEHNIPEQIIQVALEHRLMHGETLAYLLHNLPYEQKAPGATPLSYSSHGLAAPAMIDIAPGLATLGQKHGKFGWDNEFAEHQVEVPGFRIGKYKVTNGQYLDFVRDFLDAAPISTRSPLVLSRDVFRGTAPAKCAGIRHAHRSPRLCAMGRQIAARRSSVSSSRVRHARPRNTR